MIKMLNGKKLEIITLPNRRHIKEYPDFFKPNEREPELLPHTFNVSDEALRRMKETGKIALLFSALFQRMKNSFRNSDIINLEKELKAMVDLIEKESDDLYGDLYTFWRELGNFINRKDEYGKKSLPKDVKVITDTYLEKLYSKVEEVEPPDPFDVAFQKIDLEGDPCIAIKELQILFEKCMEAKAELEGKYTGYRQRGLYFRLRRNKIFITINKLYNDLAEKAEIEEEKLAYKKEASKYERILL